MADNDKKTILVIEDETMVQLLVVEILNELGFSTLEAKDANTALPILQSGQPIDLLITDIGLPGMSGWDLARLARDARPSLKILFLTGYEIAEGREFHPDASQDIIAKPFNTSEFEAKVTTMLSGALQAGSV